MATQELELAVKRITKLNGDGAIKAFCDLDIAGSFLIKGFKVVDGKKGLFVSMPREQGKNGQWYDTVAPLTKEAREQLSEAVLKAYQADAEPSLE
jgi:stage V sporulation protein G